MNSIRQNNESRVKKTILNARVNLIFYFLTLIFSFFSRKIFLNCLGSNFVGLTGTLQNLLGFLNLAELGIGTAIGYVLYKPLFDGNQDKINEIISVMGYLYRWIGFIILGSGVVLSFFLPFIFPDTGFHIFLIYFAYYSFLASSLIGYFINYRQNLLGADQRNYVVIGYFQTMNIIKTIIQMVVAYYTGSYYFWVAIELIFGIIYSYILNWKINQTYPWLKAEVSLGKKVYKNYSEVMKYVKQLFIHQINNFTQYQTTPFFVYAFVNLTTVAYFGNYTLIVDKFIMLMNTALGSTSASVGNMIAEGNNSKIVKVFWELTSLRFWIATICIVILYYLIPPFITLWIGLDYLLTNCVLILLLVKIYIQITEGCISQFLYGYGLFWDVWSSIVQTVLFLLCAVIGGIYYGLVGILSAAVLSIFLINGIWKPYFLYKYGFKDKAFKYWKLWGANMVSSILSISISAVLIEIIYENSNITKLYDFLLFGFVVTIISAVVSSAIYLLSSDGFKQIASRLLFSLKTR